MGIPFPIAGTGSGADLREGFGWEKLYSRFLCFSRFFRGRSFKTLLFLFESLNLVTMVSKNHGEDTSFARTTRSLKSIRLLWLKSKAAKGSFAIIQTIFLKNRTTSLKSFLPLPFRSS